MGPVQMVTWPGVRGMRAVAGRAETVVEMREMIVAAATVVFMVIYGVVGLFGWRP